QEENGTSQVEVEADEASGASHRWSGTGNGPLGALVAALPVRLEVMDYSEHTIGHGRQAKAADYIEGGLPGGRPPPARGSDGSLTTASLRAQFSALTRAMAQA